MKEMQKTYKMTDFSPLTDEQKKELEFIKNQKDEDIDLSDIPELNGDGGFYYFNSLKLSKTDIHTKIDNDNLEWLKKAGKGYQQRLNNVIRWARLHNCPIAEL